MARNEVLTTETSRRVAYGPKHRRVVLASDSPRRRELMAALVPRPAITSPRSEEAPAAPGQAPEEYAIQSSLMKARSAPTASGPSIVVGADTVVVHGDLILGKPADAAEARQMLRALRGRTHRVVTGVTVLDTESDVPRSVATTSSVEMRQYSDAEIAAYIASCEPFDKAGGYAVQDATFRPAESTDGCYLNIVGLPLCDVVSLINEVGAEVDLQPDWTPPVECLDCRLSQRAGR